MRILHFNFFFPAAGGANPVHQTPSAPAQQIVQQQPRGGEREGSGSSRVTATPKTVRQTPQPVTSRSQQQQNNINNRDGEISATSASEGKDSKYKVDSLFCSNIISKR